MPGQWEGSDRRDELPPGWRTIIRPRILRRDGYRCTWVTEGERCEAQATDVDHIDRGNDHRDENLASVCAWHHGRKSSAEGLAARAARARYRPTNRRPSEAHPGLI